MFGRYIIWVPKGLVTPLGLHSRLGDKLLEIRGRYVFLYSALVKGLNTAEYHGLLSYELRTAFQLRGARETEKFGFIAAYENYTAVVSPF